MKKLLFCGFLALALLAIPTITQAHPPGGRYLGSGIVRSPSIGPSYSIPRGYGIYHPYNTYNYGGLGGYYNNGIYSRPYSLSPGYGFYSQPLMGLPYYPSGFYGNGVFNRFNYFGY